MRMGSLSAAIETLEDGQAFFYSQELRSRRALNAIRTQLGLAYLLANDSEAAGRVLDPLFEDDPESPEVIRAYAALTIQREGIQQAEKAFKRLSEAKNRNRFDWCQFHLFYGLFQLGIGNSYEAAKEFALAHKADRANVFVMMKWARTLYDLAMQRYLEGDEVYQQYVTDCGEVVRKILEFDVDNPDGIDLINSLHQQFRYEVSGRRE
jgi:tetratricopeptide (TPR) repeat protein